MKMKKLLVVLVAVSLGLTSLAGCGGGSASKESKEIVVWSSMTGPDGEIIKKTFDDYNKTNPDYEVKLMTIEVNTFNKKLTTVGKSGKGVPDLAIISSESTPTFAKLGMLIPWNDAISGTEVKKENYVENAWNVGTIDGNQYGVPMTMGSWVMYYNEDLVNKYVPGALDDGVITYEEIQKAGEAAKADGIYSCANTWSMQNYQNLYLQMGGSWTDADGKLSVDNDISTAAISEYKKLNESGYLVPEGEDASKMFVNGKLIFLPEGSWMLTDMQKITDFKWGETFTPQWDANNLVQGSGVDQCVIFKADKDRSPEKMKSMAAFVEWLQGNQLDWVKSGANPTALAMLENEEYLAMPQSFLLTTEKGRDAVNIVTTDGLTFVLGEYDQRCWDMLTGRADIAKTMEEIQKLAEEKMK